MPLGLFQPLDALVCTALAAGHFFAPAQPADPGHFVQNAAFNDLW